MTWGRVVFFVFLLAFLGWNAFVRPRPMNDGWDVLRAFNRQSGFVYLLIGGIAILVLSRMRK